MNRIVVALSSCLLVAQTGLSAPVVDRHWSALGGSLFPALEAVEPGSLPAEAKAMLASRRAHLEACGIDPHCAIEKSRWTDEEIAVLARDADRALGTVRRQYVPPDDGVPGEVARQLAGLNAILSVYGLGSPSRYPKIDGPTVDEQSTAKAERRLRAALDLAIAGKSDPTVGLDPSIGLALSLLDVNDRDEPVAFEPLDTKLNNEALAKAQSVNWGRYRYSAIIVPGIGPDDPAAPLSAHGKLNVRMAAERFGDGIAPFIIVSGSNVHPRGTRFTEALEMREALIERFGIPADSIVVEPYARHTTTNLRNAARRLMALGAPLSKDTLIVTNADQSQYIESAKFVDRNQIELGYQPGKAGKRLSATDLVWRPAASSLRVDPMDPLDP